MPPTSRRKRRAQGPAAPVQLTAQSSREEVEAWLLSEESKLPSDIAKQVFLGLPLPARTKPKSNPGRALAASHCANRVMNHSALPAHWLLPCRRPSSLTAWRRRRRRHVQLIAEWRSRGELFDGETLLGADEALLMETGASRTVAHKIVKRLKEVRRRC